MEGDEDIVREASLEAYGGMTVKEIIGRLPKSVVKRAALSEVRSLLEEAIDQRTGWEEVTAEGGDGKELWEKMSGNMQRALDILKAVKGWK